MLKPYHGMLGLAGLLVLTAVITASPAAAAEDGKTLHDARCLGACHGTEMYTRPERKRNTLMALTRQVEMCNTMVRTGDPWFDEEVAAVVDYLNQNFYHVK